MNQVEKAKTFGREIKERMPNLTDSQYKVLAHAFTAAQHGYPRTSQGIHSADKTYYYVMYGVRHGRNA